MLLINNILIVIFNCIFFRKIPLKINAQKYFLFNYNKIKKPEIYQAFLINIVAVGIDFFFNKAA